MPTKYLVTIPDSAEWQESTRDLPYRRVTARLSIYTLYLDLIDADEDEDSMYWAGTIYDNIAEAEVYTSDDLSWDEDDLETAQEEIVETVLDLLHGYLVDDFDAVEISNDTESGIDSLDLEN